MDSSTQEGKKPKALEGALWLGVALILATAASPIWERPWHPSLEERCKEDCIQVQVTGVEGREGIYRVPRSTTLKQFLGWLRIPLDDLEELVLEEWTRLDFQDAPGKLPPRVGHMSESAKYLLGQPMDLNRAGIRDLTLLPGIGPGLARRIVDERRRGGPFGSPSDLARVKGIPRKTLDGIQPLLAAGG